MMEALILPFMLLFTTVSQPAATPQTCVVREYRPQPKYDYIGPPSCPCETSFYGECIFGYGWRTDDDLWIEKCPKCHSVLRSVVWVDWKKRFEYIPHK